MPRCRFGEATRLWGFDGAQSGAMAPSCRMNRRMTSRRGGWRCGEAGFEDDAEAKKARSGQVRQSCPLSAMADAKRTYR